MSRSIYALSTIGLFLAIGFIYSASAAPATPAIPADPHSATSTPGTSSSTQPRATPGVPSDDAAPVITALSISPTSVQPGEPVTFTVSAHDRGGMGNVTFDIVYPADPSHDGPFGIRPNCNFLGDKQGTCTFSESIDHATQPTILGEYVIESVRITDLNGNVATYLPDGTLVGGRKETHSFEIPSIQVQ